MSQDYQKLYQEQTLFDQLGLTASRLLRGVFARSRLPGWIDMFQAFACACLLGAGGLIFTGLANATRWPQIAATLTGAVLLGVAARHFTRLGFASGGWQPAVPGKPAGTRKRDRSRASSRSGDFLKALQDTGISMRIASELSRKGINSRRRICCVSDAVLLSVHGIGPETVKKLRARFGPPRQRG